MKFTVVLLFAFVAPVARAGEVVKLFSDQGKTYLRSDDASGLVPGAELSAFSDAAGTRTLGKAIVMEVTGQLARVTLDEDAAKGPAKYVRVIKSAAAPVAALTTAAPPPPPPSSTPARPVLNGVLGRKEYAITVHNQSDSPWTECEIIFPDKRHARAGRVDPNRTVPVSFDKIQPAPDCDDESVLVRCREGEAELNYAQPQEPHALQGWAQRTFGGGIVLHNDSSVDWSQCDLIKRNGKHFFQGSLRARAEDSIRGGLFKLPTGPEVITLTCAQGELSQPVPE